MARRMKIFRPRPHQRKPKGWYYYTKRKTSSEWLYGRFAPSGQKPQSRIREWAEFTDDEKAAVLERTRSSRYDARTETRARRES